MRTYEEILKRKKATFVVAIGCFIFCAANMGIVLHLANKLGDKLDLDIFWLGLMIPLLCSLGGGCMLGLSRLWGELADLKKSLPGTDSTA